MNAAPAVPGARERKDRQRPGDHSALRAYRSISERPAPTVSIAGSHYLVDLDGPDGPRLHRVSKDKTCSCGAPHCEAIEAVRQYLQGGGARAPEPAEPTVCPICGAKTLPDPRWNGPYTRSPGWRCRSGGLSHFLLAKAQHIRQRQAENPWLFPPAPAYPGVRREDILTWQECDAFNRKVYAETGYDPTR